MEAIATLANGLWSAANQLAAWRFCRALRRPGAAQERQLQAYLDANASTAFGREYRFAAIRTYQDFVRRVPLADYSAMAPWLNRVRCGERRVLTREPVIRLLPTSGSSGPGKLIPFTATSQREADAALGPWLLDLQRRTPGLLGGPTYWSATPPLHRRQVEASTVPIGSGADMAFWAGARWRLADGLKAVDAPAQQVCSLEEFQYGTLLHLLRHRELRLISVWHPSFFIRLLETLPALWEKLLETVGRGSSGAAPLPQRAAQLRALAPTDAAGIWPQLRVLSCWADGAAAPGADELRRRFPHAVLQPKGLLATEAFVTVPFQGRYPLAVQSHFFEFINRTGEILPLSGLQLGEEYELVVTTGGGLWRYRLGDRVRVTDWLERTPCCQFLGRAEQDGNESQNNLREELCRHRYSTFTTTRPWARA